MDTISIKIKLKYRKVKNKKALSQANYKQIHQKIWLIKDHSIALIRN